VTDVDGTKNGSGLADRKRSLLGAMLPIPAREQLRQAAIRDPLPEPLATVFRRAAISPLLLLSVGAAPLFLGLNVLRLEIKARLGLP
jgi:hypothetical protein